MIAGQHLLIDFSFFLYAYLMRAFFYFDLGDNLIWTPEERAVAAPCACGAKIRPLLRVRDSGGDLTDRSFYSYRSLASVYLARDWEFRK